MGRAAGRTSSTEPPASSAIESNQLAVSLALLSALGYLAYFYAYTPLMDRKKQSQARKTADLLQAEPQQAQQTSQPKPKARRPSHKSVRDASDVQAAQDAHNSKRAQPPPAQGSSHHSRKKRAAKGNGKQQQHQSSEPSPVGTSDPLPSTRSHGVQAKPSTAHQAVQAASSSLDADGDAPEASTSAAASFQGREPVRISDDAAPTLNRGDAPHAAESFKRTHKHQLSTASSYNGPPTAKPLPERRRSVDSSPTSSIYDASLVFSPGSASSSTTAPPMRQSASEQSCQATPTLDSLSNDSPLRSDRLEQMTTASPSTSSKKRRASAHRQTSWVPGMPKLDPSTAPHAGSSSSDASPQRQAADHDDYWKQDPRGRTETVKPAPLPTASTSAVESTGASHQHATSLRSGSSSAGSDAGGQSAQNRRLSTISLGAPRPISPSLPGAKLYKVSHPPTPQHYNTDFSSKPLSQGQISDHARPRRPSTQLRSTSARPSFSASFTNGPAAPQQPASVSAIHSSSRSASTGPNLQSYAASNHAGAGAQQPANAAAAMSYQYLLQQQYMLQQQQQQLLATQSQQPFIQLQNQLRAMQMQMHNSAFYGYAGTDSSAVTSPLSQQQQWNRKAPPPALMLPNGSAALGVDSSRGMSSAPGSVSPMSMNMAARPPAQHQQQLAPKSSQYLASPSAAPSRPLSRANSISSVTSSHAPLTTHTGDMPSISPGFHPGSLPSSAQELDRNMVQRLNQAEERLLAAEVENERKSKELEIAAWSLHCVESERVADERQRVETVHALEDRLRLALERIRHLEEQFGLVLSSAEEDLGLYRRPSLSTSDYSHAGSAHGSPRSRSPIPLPRLETSGLRSSSGSHLSQHHQYASPTHITPLYQDFLNLATAPSYTSPSPVQRHYSQQQQLSASGQSSTHRRKARRSGAKYYQKNRNDASPSPGEGAPPPESTSAQPTEDQDDVVILLRPDSTMSKELAADRALNSSLLGLGFDLENGHTSPSDSDGTGPEPGEDWIGSIPKAFVKKPTPAASSTSDSASPDSSIEEDTTTTM